MSTRTLFKLLAMGAVGVMLSVGPTSATCTGTLYTPSADGATSPGQRMGGDYGDTASSNDTREAFNETLSGGVSRLIHTWTFNNLPAGSAKLIREGYRLGSSDNDNFKFQVGYDYGSGIQMIFGSFCTISSETEGSLECDLGTTTNATATWSVDLRDTVTGSGTTLTAVAIDYVAICIE